MQDFTPTRRERIDGLALFAAVAFAIGVGAIATLERVGAPDGFVEALGPLFAFAMLSVIGLANRAVNLTDFLAARRAGPVLYGGLAFIALVAGVVLARAEAAGRVDAVAWTPIAIGAAFAGLVVAPALRATQVSAIPDVLATRFPAAPLRIVFSLVVFAIGLLTALAGFRLATQALAAEFQANARLGAAFVVAALVFTLAPGGARSAFWTDAASGGGALMIALFGALLAALNLSAPWAPLGAGLARLTDDVATAGAQPGPSVALAVAFAFFLPLTTPALAARSEGEAMRMGAAGVVLAFVALAAAVVALPYVAGAPGGASHTGQALISAATWLPTVALARSGAWISARAIGLDLTRTHTRLTVLSSQRIALSRLAMLATIAICPFVLRFSEVSAGGALTFALALTLAFVAPSLLLAMTLRSRGSSFVAAGALFAASTSWGLSWKVAPAAFHADGVLIQALLAGAAGLAIGAFVALVYPDRADATALPTSDAFAETPFDPVD